MMPTPQNQYQGYNYIPQQNSYMDRIAQAQQYQQNMPLLPAQMSGAYQQPGLVGKIVNDVSMVSPNDVPMDGSIAIFPKGDMSEIYCKQWKQDGTIQTVVYKPILDQNQADYTNTQMDFNTLNEDMRALREDIKEMRSMIENSISAQPVKTARNKKTEVSADE